MNRGFRRFKRNRAEGQGAVDLGLSNLIGAPDPLPETGNDAVSSTGNLEGEQQDLPESAPPEMTRFELLARDEKWEDLAQTCDRILASDLSNPGDFSGIEARLWWLKSQLEGEFVPVSILASVLDNASRGVVEKLGIIVQSAAPVRRLLELASSILIKAAAIMLVDNRDSQAIDFMERALILNPQAAREIESICRKFLTVSMKSGQPDKGLIARIEKLYSSLPVSQRAEQNGPADAASTKPEILRQAEVSSAQIITQHSAKRAGAYMWLVLACVLFGAIWYGSRDNLFTQSSAEPTPGFVPEVLPSAIEAPRLEPVTGLSNIDAIFFDISRTSGKDRQTALQPPAGQLSTIQNQLPTSHPGRREVLDTTQPVEPRDVYSAVTSRAAESSVQSNDQGDSAVQAGERREPSDSRGYEPFDPPRMFEIIAETSVMREPSIRADTLATLKSGDKIMVDGREGYWLRVRSKKGGRRGYVLGQDATRNSR